MTIDELFKELEDTTNILFEDKIVTLKYKYDNEDEYTIDNQILYALNGEYCWLFDWNEGQTDVEVLGYKSINDISTYTNANKCDFCKRYVYKNTSSDYCDYGYQNMCNFEIKDEYKDKIVYWIIVEYDYFKCSNCNKCNNSATRFCPNCGAETIGVDWGKYYDFIK